MCTMCAVTRPCATGCDFDAGAAPARLTEGADAPAGITTPYAIVVGDSFAGMLGRNDRDYIRIETVAGQEITLSLAGGSEGPIEDGFLRLYDAGGRYLDFDDDDGPGLDAQLTFVATGGSYYVAVSSAHTEFADGVVDAGSYLLTSQIGRPDPGPVVFTTDEIARQLTTGYWGGAQQRIAVAPGDAISADIGALTAAGQQFAVAALGAWSAVTGLRFTTAVPAGGGTALIRFDDDAPGAFAGFTTSNAIITGAEINISTDWIAGDEGRLDSYGFQTYLHEIGHALGLGHAGNYNGDAVWGVDNLYENDSWQASVMSYFSQRDNTFVDASFAYAITPMMADILAIGQLYGTGGALRTADTVYGRGSTAGGIYDVAFTQRSAVTLTIVDDGGRDTLDLSFSAQNAVIDLNGDRVSSFGGLTGNLSIMRGTVIEVLRTGAGRDSVTGNAADNLFVTGLGADTVNGGGGSDTVSLAAAVGAVRANLATGVVSGALGADVLRNVENVVGSGFGDLLSGSDSVNSLWGEGGNDTLQARGSDDALWGGRGDDSLTGGAFRDQLDGGEGADILLGAAGDDVLRGGAGADMLTAGDGRDLADGGEGADNLQGGRGLDTMTGGGGNDALWGGDDGDLLAGGAGTDRIFGDSGNDTLRGEAGSDLLTGGSGADRFVFGTLTGSDRITDWQDGIDRLDLIDWGFADFGALLGLVRTAGTSLRLEFADATRLVIDNLAPDLFDATDVLLA